MTTSTIPIYPPNLINSQTKINMPIVNLKSKIVIFFVIFLVLGCSGNKKKDEKQPQKELAKAAFKIDNTTEVGVMILQKIPLPFRLIMSKKT